MQRPEIRVKSMLVAVNDEGTAHAVSVNPPTLENPDGYHRLIGGGVEFGEMHRDAILREVREELDVAICGLRLLGVVENIFEIDGAPGHEIVFIYAGSLDPAPAASGATLVEADGTMMPVVWRSFDDAREVLPLFPADARRWLDVARARDEGDRLHG